MTHLYDIVAPAKLNLFLHVLDRRVDGYHRLQTVFRLIDLCDTLHVEVRADGRISREGGLADVAPEADLTVRAARALQVATGTRAGAHIALVKRIPAGGGLGGGSSDAASVLLALNRLWRTGLTRAQLLQLALPLGTDVPFFIFGCNAFAQGVGDALTALALPARTYLVAKPDAQVATRAVFGAPDLPRATPACTVEDVVRCFSENFQVLPSPPPFPTSGRGCSKQRGNNSPLPLGGREAGGEGVIHTLRFKNDLEPVARALSPAVDAAARLLQRLNIPARMTGSGACFFAEFADRDAALLAQNEIAATMRVADSDAIAANADVAANPAVVVNPDKRRAVIVWTQVCQGLDAHPLAHWVTDQLGSRQVG